MNIGDGFNFWIGKILAELAYVGVIFLIIVACVIVGLIIEWRRERKQCTSKHAANVRCTLDRGHMGRHFSSGVAGTYQWTDQP